MASVTDSPLARSWLEERSCERWLVTGAAGFIGSHLTEHLLRCGQAVTALDNFSTGSRRNLERVREAVGETAWHRVRLIEGDVAQAEVCERALEGVSHVLHQAALGSVPRSLHNPMDTLQANVLGFAQLLTACVKAGVQRVVYASSSSVYGDQEAQLKVEPTLGQPLSPYALSKRVDELLAQTWSRCYGLETVGLRYFNVFGPRQDPSGAYAAVIPLWAHALLSGETVWINGDGQHSRDFCFVENVVQANLRAALLPALPVVSEVFNIACGAQTNLLQLIELMRSTLSSVVGRSLAADVRHREARAGDPRHSLADISHAQAILGYAPTHSIEAGLQRTLRWYAAQFSPERATAERSPV